ncbi:hypothetical protein DFH07DRAFT_833336, partial [Mycena maculata]
LALKQVYINAIGQPAEFDWARLEFDMPGEKARGMGMRCRAGNSASSAPRSASHEGTCWCRSTTSACARSSAGTARARLIPVHHNMCRHTCLANTR